MSHFLYIGQSSDPDRAGTCKIGETKNWRTRFTDNVSLEQVGLDMVRVYKFRRAEVAQKVEQRVKELLAAYQAKASFGRKIGTEWFNVSPSVARKAVAQAMDELGVSARQVIAARSRFLLIRAVQYRWSIAAIVALGGGLAYRFVPPEHLRVFSSGMVDGAILAWEAAIRPSLELFWSSFTAGIEDIWARISEHLVDLDGESTPTDPVAAP